jgi:hypothetical protein
MKKLLFIILFIPLFVNAQTDSVKVSFSEEKVEKFEKTTLMDEYDKAFGVNRKVNAALKVGLDFSGIYMTNIFVNYERKFAKDWSLNLGVQTGRIRKESFKYIIEPRWYFKMKKRIEDGSQGDNLNGEYLSLRYEHGENESNYSLNSRFNFEGLTRNFNENIPIFNSQKLGNPIYNKLLLNYGRQFGNTIDFAFSTGLLDRNQLFIESRADVPYLKSERRLSWVVSSNTRLSLGLFFPTKNFRELSNKCDFLLCNYEVKSLLKLDLSNLIYLDNTQKQLNFGGSYERKIGKSAFSSNTGLNLFFNSWQSISIKSHKDTVINGNRIWTNVLFNDKMGSDYFYGFNISEQLRYYIGMKRRVELGKSANNLNGIYAGFNISYSYYRNDFTANTLAIPLNATTGKYSISTFNYGFSIGNQRQTAKNAFVDYGLTLFPTNYNEYDGIYISNVKKTLGGNFYLKFGIAR